MDELEKGLEISLTGEPRARVLRRAARQLASWGVALPPVGPLVLDFGLGRFQEIGLVEYWIANEAEAGYCGKYLFVFDGQTCPTHRHGAKTETFFVVHGNVRMTLDGRAQDMAPGEVLRVPHGRSHSFTGIGPALLLELSTPCEIDDNEFSNPAIPIGRSAE